METTTNFIRHLRAVSSRFIEDDRLSPWHISMYYALFHAWNHAKFINPISVCRDELMRAAKIGSANTYIKCLKELDAWQYIRYEPSHNPYKGSKVHLYTFDTTASTSSDITTDNTSVKPVRPSINNTKPEKQTKQPAAEEVKAYFEEKGSTGTEAEKYYNYYSSTGWKVGGRTAMKDWKAAARNWIIKAAEIKTPSQVVQKRHNHHTSTDKNYAEPL